MKRSKRILRNNKIKKKLILPVLVLLFIVWSVSTWIPVTERLELDILKEPGEDVRIVLVTDLHSCKYGEEQKSLLI